jgi:hypothetical protein
MIDTDKYEGHTEGKWVFKHINSNWYQCDKIGEIHMEDIAIKEASANAQLMADAPLLLAEVKRLTALFEETNHHLDLMVERFGIEALVEMVGEEE